MNNKIILITGPGGSGKSTIAELLSDKYGYTLIDGDQLDTEFFPDGGQWFPENQEKLKKAHDKIINTAKKEFNLGKNVVIDYIIFGDYLNFIDNLKYNFGNQFSIKVLFPDEDENILRDKKRDCWTTGPESIRRVRAEFSTIKAEVGEDNYISTLQKTPEETAKIILGIK